MHTSGSTDEVQAMLSSTVIPTQLATVLLKTHLYFICTLSIKSIESHIHLYILCLLILILHP